MKTEFLSEVLSILQPFPVEVLSFQDSKHIDAEVSKLPWRGENIQWKNQKHAVIDFTQEGEYSAKSAPRDSLRRFLALQGEKVVIMFSAFEPPVAMAADDFLENWLDICSNFIFLPKVILVSVDELGKADPGIIEINPMEFIKGHV